MHVTQVGGTLVALAALVPLAAAAAGQERKAAPRVEAAPAAPAPAAGMRRFMVVRTFAPGALDGLDAAGKRGVNEKNAREDVRWVFSFANAERTKTFCLYDGPSEEAVRRAAQANSIPVDSIVEVPLVLLAR